MLICPQCGIEIDTTAPYSLGGEVGLLGEITRPCHFGDCETMPTVFLEQLGPVADRRLRPKHGYTQAWKDRIDSKRFRQGTLRDRGFLRRGDHKRPEEN